MDLLSCHSFAHQILPRYRNSSLLLLALRSQRRSSSRRLVQHRCKASSSPANVTSRGRSRDGDVDRPLPSWVAWDQEALTQQAAGLVELQASSLPCAGIAKSSQMSSWNSEAIKWLIYCAERLLCLTADGKDASESTGEAARQADVQKELPTYL